MTAPVWGPYAARGNPKACSLPELFVTPLLRGAMGAASTLAFIMVGRAPGSGDVRPARIGAGFVGPVVATTLLTWTSPGARYVLLAAIRLAGVPLITMREAGARA